MSLNQYFNSLTYDKSKVDKDMTKQELIENHLKLVVKIAHQFRKYAPIEDLIQEGNLGLIDAVNRFDRTKNNKFSTYASFYIKHKMWKFMRNNFPVKGGIGKVKIVYPDEQIENNWSYNHDNNFETWNKPYKSLNDIDTDTDTDISPLQQIIYNEDINRLYNCIEKLKPIEKDIINSRFNEKKCTLNKLAKKWKCTIPNIHIIEKTALKKLRKMIK